MLSLRHCLRAAFLLALYTLKGCAHFWVFLLLFSSFASAQNIEIKRFLDPVKNETVKKELKIKHENGERTTYNSVYTAHVRDNMKDMYPIGFDYSDDGNNYFFYFEPRYIEWDIPSDQRGSGTRVHARFSGKGVSIC